MSGPGTGANIYCALSTVFGRRRFGSRTRPSINVELELNPSRGRGTGSFGQPNPPDLPWVDVGGRHALLRAFSPRIKFTAMAAVKNVDQQADDQPDDETHPRHQREPSH
jgi:hypothetical protein